MLKIKVKSALPGFWYSDFIGSVFNVSLVRAKFRHHVYQPNVFEVIDGHHAGDVLFQGDCEVVQ